MKRSIGFRAQPGCATSGTAGRLGGMNAQCDWLGGTPGCSPAIALAPWSIQSSSRLISASASGGRFKGMRSVVPSPRTAAISGLSSPLARQRRPARSCPP